MRHLTWLVLISIALVVGPADAVNRRRHTTALTVQRTTVIVVWAAVEADEDANQRRQRLLSANPIRLRRLVVDGTLEVADVAVPSGRYRLRLQTGGVGPMVEIQDAEGKPLTVAAAERVSGEAPAEDPDVLLEAGTGGTVVMRFPNRGQWWQVVLPVAQTDAKDGESSGEGDA